MPLQPEHVSWEEVGIAIQFAELVYKEGLPVADPLPGLGMGVLESTAMPVVPLSIESDPVPLPSNFRVALPPSPLSMRAVENEPHSATSPVVSYQCLR